MFDFKSVMKPENSIIAGIATAGLVYAIYQMDVGPVSTAHASDANHPSLESSRKKAGYTSFIAVAGLTLMTRDTNIGILGFVSIIAMEAHYRHAIMSDPNTGKIMPPADSVYQAAENVVPLPTQGQPTGVAVGY